MRPTRVESFEVRRLPQIRKPALPADWGWIQSEEAWKINWTTLPSIAACCQELPNAATRKTASRGANVSAPDFLVPLCAAVFVTSSVVGNRVQLSNI